MRLRMSKRRLRVIRWRVTAAARWPVVEVLAAASMLAVAGAASASTWRIPTGHYVGQTSQHTVVAFDFVKKKGIVPALSPSGPALYSFATTVTFRCNNGGNLRRRVFDAAALTGPHGVFAENGSGTTPMPGESQQFSYQGQLRQDGHASGMFRVEIMHVHGTEGRTCSTGAIRWSATLKRTG